MNFELLNAHLENVRPLLSEETLEMLTPAPTFEEFSKYDDDREQAANADSEVL